MEKRYQVFVSSTYEDLKEERLELMSALLEMDCIPCGMEYFPAASEDQSSYVSDLITGCDYLVVVVAGRYGATDSTGISFTEREYDHAVKVEVPTLSFLHSDPDSLPAKYVEQTTEAQQRLRAFRKKLKTRLCRHWSSSQQLSSIVSRSLVHLMKTHPRVGWVRGDMPPGNAQSANGEELTIGLHHISLPVRHLPTSIDFYQNVLRLRPRPRPRFEFPGAWFEFPDGQQQLHLIQYQRGKDLLPTFRTEGEIDFKDVHFAIRVRDYDAMFAIFANSTAKFVKGPRQFQFYVTDPDGHIVEITGPEGPGPKRYA